MGSAYADLNFNLIVKYIFWMFAQSMKEAVVSLCKMLGVSCRKASSVLEPSKSTISRWINESNNNFTSRREKKRKRGRVGKLLTDRVIQFICRSIKSNPFITVDRIRYNIFKKLGVRLSEGTVYRAFKLCNIRRKRVSVRMYNRTLASIKKEVDKFLCDIKNMDLSKVICIDETYVWQNVPLSYGRAPGSERVVKYMKRSEKIRVSIIMAVCNKEIIAYEKYEDTINSTVYLDFLKKHIFDKFSGHYLLMDNVKFHKTKMVRNGIEESGNMTLYIPPYSPQCNAIEEVFSKIKHYVKKQISSKQIKDLQKCIDKAVNTITEKDLKNYYKHAYA